jgi:AcrR family transcriptional regulator
MERKGMALATNRRIGQENSTTRELLMDGVEKVMIEQGYASLTARSVAESVGLKHQIVYYYFLTMEDLIVASFRRRAAQVMIRVEEAILQTEPLKALWAVHAEPAHAALTVEYLALANHNEAIRRETVSFGELMRRMGLDRVAARLGVPVDGPRVINASALTLALSSLGAILGMESAVGITGGHHELRALMVWCLDRLQGQAV